jgi:hypothetical protein
MRQRGGSKQQFSGYDAECLGHGMQLGLQQQSVQPGTEQRTEFFLGSQPGYGLIIRVTGIEVLEIERGGGDGKGRRKNLLGSPEGLASQK